MGHLIFWLSLISNAAFADTSNTCKWRLIDEEVVCTAADALESAILDEDHGENCVYNSFVALSKLGHQGTALYRYLSAKENIVEITPVSKGMIAVDRVTILLRDLVRHDGDKITLFPMAHSFLLLHNGKAFVICDAFEKVRRLECRKTSQAEIDRLNQAVKDYVLKQNKKNYDAVLEFFLNDSEQEAWRRLEFEPMSLQKYQDKLANKCAVFFKDMEKRDTDAIGRFFQRLANANLEPEKISEQLGCASLAKIPLIESTHVEIPTTYRPPARPAAPESWWQKWIPQFN